MKKADASTQAAQLLKFRNPTESEWSRDGQWLIFRTAVSQPGKGDIFAIRPGRDSAPMPIAATPFAEAFPAISPDGRWLAYASNETGHHEVYVVPFPNASSAKWPVSSGGGTEPVWSRNGRELFYRDGAGNMVSVEIGSSTTFSAGTSKILFSARGYRSGHSHRQYDVAPDGRFMMVRDQILRGGADTIFVVDNWFEELKAKARK